MGVLVLIIVVAIAELYVIVQVANHIGVLATIALLVLISASGPWLVRHTGLGVWRRARTRLTQGDMPGREIVDGVLLLAAGVLLTIPGFLTGIVGLLLLLPPVRALVRWFGSRRLVRRYDIRVWNSHGFGGRDGDVITAGSRSVDHTAPTYEPPSLEPPSDPRDRGDAGGRAAGRKGRPPAGAEPVRERPPAS